MLIFFDMSFIYNRLQTFLSLDFIIFQKRVLKFINLLKSHVPTKVWKKNLTKEFSAMS